MTSNTKILLLNGPKLSGKDTLADALVERHPDWCTKQMFKDSLYEATADYFNVDKDWLIVQANDRVTKEVPDNDDLDGYSPRGALIHVSEDIYKPRYGQDIFGQKAAQKIVQGYLNVFSDSGFIDEAFPLIQHYGRENVQCVQIYRNGCTFKHDSRRYIGTPSPIVQLGEAFEHVNDEDTPLDFPELRTLALINNGSLDACVNWIDRFVVEMYYGVEPHVL